MQYLDWLWRTLRGDFGTSLYFKTDVVGLIWASCRRRSSSASSRSPSRSLISIPLGVFAAVFRNSWIDRLALAIAVVGQALPNFFFALLLIMLFSIQLRWLPVSGSGSWAHFVMPTIALGYYIAPAFMRLVRAGMVEVLVGRLHPHGARARACRRRSVVFKHALRNAVVPVVALAAVQLGFLLGGSVVIETIFALDGLGYLAYQSITHKDFPVTQAVVLLLSVFYVLLTLAADIANAWLDPRIRVGPMSDSAAPPLDVAVEPSADARLRRRVFGTEESRDRRRASWRVAVLVAALRAAARAARSLCAGPDAPPDPADLVREGQLGRIRSAPTISAATTCPAPSTARASRLLIGVVGDADLRRHRHDARPRSPAISAARSTSPSPS